MNVTKSVCAVLLSITSLCLSAKEIEKKDSLKIVDSESVLEVKEPISKDTKILDPLDRAGGGGGFVVKFNKLNTKNFETVFTSNGFESPSEDLILQGGKGMYQFACGLRVGGAGFGGSTNEKQSNNIASYGLNYGGLIVGQMFDIRFIRIVPEILIGGGSADVEVYSDFKNGKKLISGPVIEPSLNLEVSLTDWLTFGAGASFLHLIETGKKSYGDELNANLEVSDLSYSVQILFGKLI